MILKGYEVAWKRQHSALEAAGEARSDDDKSASSSDTEDDEKYQSSLDPDELDYLQYDIYDPENGVPWAQLSVKETCAQIHPRLFLACKLGEHPENQDGDQTTPCRNACFQIESEGRFKGARRCNELPDAETCEGRKKVFERC